MQLALAGIKGRVARLERLAVGLDREADLQRGAVDLLLYRERKQYLAAMRDALSGVEAARVVLVRAVRRMEGE
jgi:hypothetical protein